MIFHLLAKCTHDKPLNLRIVKIIQCLSSWNTVRIQLQSRILHQHKICSLCLVVITFQFVLCNFATDILLVLDHHSNAYLSWLHLAQMRDQILLPQWVSLFKSDKIQTLHTFLRLLRKDWADLHKQLCEKQSQSSQCQRNSVSTSFPLPLLLSTPLNNGLVARKIGCPLSPNFNIIIPAVLSHSPCGLSSQIEYHFFSDPSPKNDHCPAPNFFAQRETIWAFASHSLLSSLDHHEMSKKHRHEDNPSSKNCLVLRSMLTVTPGLCTSVMWWILVNYSTWIPLVHHQSCPRSCMLMNFWTTSICFPKQSLIEGVRSSFQDTIQNLRICRSLCAGERWFLHR